MATLDVDALGAATIAGSENIFCSQGGVAKRITPDLQAAWTIDTIEALDTLAAPAAGDSFMMLENGTKLESATYATVEDAIAETMYAETEIGGALADADVFLVNDNAAAKKTCLASRIATYTLGKNTATIRDISGTSANSTPAAAHLLMTIDGSTAKKTTWAEMEASTHAAFATYTQALSAAGAGADANSFYVIQSGAAKEMTLLQLKTYVGVSVTAVGTPTGGKLAVWATASSLEDSQTVVVAATGFTTGSDVTMPTTACVRTEMNDIIFDEGAMGSALADADTFLICDGDLTAKQYKATLTQLATWIGTKYVEQSHIADTAACAAITFTSHNWDGSTDPTQAEGDKIKADLAAIKTNLDLLNATQDSINAAQAAFGVTAAS